MSIRTAPSSSPDARSGCRLCVGMAYMAYTYILQTAQNSYYVGSTDNLEKRLKAHNAGKVISTKNKLPVRLVFKEWYATRGEAQKKEYQIKNWKSKKLVEKIIQLGPIV